MKTKVVKHVSPVSTEERKKADIRPGDTVRVWIKIQEKGRTRLQPFEGVVIARKHGTEPGATFTVRRMASGVGVEKIFPLYSPVIEKVEVVRRAKVRRAKLYYIREKAAREIRKKMRRLRFETQEVIGTVSLPQEERFEEEEENKEKGEREDTKKDAQHQKDEGVSQDSKEESSG